MTALEIERDEDKNIKIDFGGDLEKYSDLDEFIDINAVLFSREEAKKYLQLCDICPKMKIEDSVSKALSGFSTTEEYKASEIWIESILQELNPNWSNIQKIAYIDNAIGKKISYSPDFDTEVFDKRRSTSIMEDNKFRLWYM